MKTPSTFTTVYTEWLDTFRSMIPGGSHASPAGKTAPKAEQVAAVQEWEDEGGCIKPEKKPGLAPAPKIPL